MHEQLRKFLEEESNLDFKEILSDKRISLALKKFDTINNLGFPSINAFLYLLNPILNDLKLPMETTLNHMCDQVNHLAELIAA